MYDLQAFYKGVPNVIWCSIELNMNQIICVCRSSFRAVCSNLPAMLFRRTHTQHIICSREHANNQYQRTLICTENTHMDRERTTNDANSIYICVFHLMLGEEETTKLCLCHSIMPLLTVFWDI